MQTGPRMLTAEQLAFLDESIGELGLSVRTANMLENMGILFVRELLNTEPGAIANRENVGDKTMEEIFECLAAKGFLRSKPLPKFEKSYDTKKPATRRRPVIAWDVGRSVPGGD